MSRLEVNSTEHNHEPTSEPDLDPPLTGVQTVRLPIAFLTLGGLHTSISAIRSDFASLGAGTLTVGTDLIIVTQVALLGTIDLVVAAIARVHAL